MSTYKSPDNSLHYLDNDAFVYLLPTESVPITDEEATFIRTAQQAQAQANISYAQKRVAAYPSIGDQLDMLWHLMDTGVIPGKDSTWYQAIKAVKAQYPKS